MNSQEPRLAGSVRAVREALRRSAAGLAPDDADGTLAARVAELQQRVQRLNRQGAALRHVRLSQDVLALFPTALATA